MTRIAPPKQQQTVGIEASRDFNEMGRQATLDCARENSTDRLPTWSVMSRKVMDVDTSAMCCIASALRLLLIFFQLICVKTCLVNFRIRCVG